MHRLPSLISSLLLHLFVRRNELDHDSRKFNPAEVQAGAELQRCGGGADVQSCRVAEVVLRFSRGGCAVDCAGAEVVQRLCRGARFSNKCGAEQVLVV